MHGNRVRNQQSLWRPLAFCVVGSMLAGCSAGTGPAVPDARFIAEAEALTDRFQSELQAALSPAMTETGPVGAIGVCQSSAPAIAQRLSEESGMTIGRIARRNRNAGNVIGSELVLLYAQLEEAPMKEGAPTAVHARVGDRQIYMRAIPMQEQPCAACHGTNVADEVKAAIDQAYPADLAIGFGPGELRGVFLVEASDRRAR